MESGDDLMEATTILFGDRECRNEKAFFRFLECCDRVSFFDPVAGLRLARHAPRLAEEIAPSVKVPQKLYVAAFSALGTAYRATGDHSEAESKYQEAEAHGQFLSKLETVDIVRRIANLRLGQGRRDEALEMIDDAILTYRIQGDLAKREFLGRCYVLRGEINLHRGDSDQAVLDTTTSLTHLDLTHESIYNQAAIHNLMVALASCSSADALGQALKLLKQAEKRTHYKGHRMPKYKLRWLKAIICLRFGSTRQAIRFLTSARDGLAKLGAFHDFVLISLDLNEAYFMEARPGWEIEALAQETYDLARSMNAEQEVLAALLQWRDAAAREELTEEILSKVRERADGGMGR